MPTIQGRYWQNIHYRQSYRKESRNMPESQPIPALREKFPYSTKTTQFTSTFFGKYKLELRYIVTQHIITILYAVRQSLTQSILPISKMYFTFALKARYTYFFITIRHNLQFHTHTLALNSKRNRMSTTHQINCRRYIRKIIDRFTTNSQNLITLAQACFFGRHSCHYSIYNRQSFHRYRRSFTTHKKRFPQCIGKRYAMSSTILAQHL